MSKYSTELRYALADMLHLTDVDTFDYDNIIDNTYDSIFSTSNNTDFDTFLQKAILKRYYLNEIGFDTFAEFKMKICNYYDCNRAKYDIFYKSIEKIKIDDFKNVITKSGTISEDNTKTNTNSHTNTGSNSETTSKTVSDINKYSDTPQGALNGVFNDNYLTNASVNSGSESNTKTGSDSTTHSGSASDVEDKDKIYTETIHDDSDRFVEIEKVLNLNLDKINEFVNEYRKFFMLIY